MIPHGSARAVACSAKAVRQTFIDYFTSRGHSLQKPSPLLAPPKSSIIFTNAGMNQFVDVLCGERLSTTKKAVNSQLCARVGGKHNDLKDVGLDHYHHTLFEMLGNWSFGDYFKEEACFYALDLLTNEYGIPRESLVISYFNGDNGISPDIETHDIWLKLGIPHSRLISRGAVDNFWEMGSSGPCGPCSEIHVLHPHSHELRELWNLVFISYNRTSSGLLLPLSVRHVDTGMGLERLAAYMQGSKSNYETDLFRPIISALEKLSDGDCYDPRDTSQRGNAFRMVADHMRFSCVALTQGILPDHRDAGNKLRRVMRRASDAAFRHLGVKRGSLETLVPVVAECLEHIENVDVSLVQKLFNEEELRYVTQLRRADKILSKSAVEPTMSGELAWSLYSVCGLQRETIEDMARERSQTVDWITFDQHLKAFQEKSQVEKHALWCEENLNKIAEDLWSNDAKPTDTSPIYAYRTKGSYEFSPIRAELVAVFDINGEQIDRVAEGDRVCVVTEKTPFYYEAGGQMSDRGSILTDDGDVIAIERVVLVHGFVMHCGVSTWSFSIPKHGSSTLVLQVDSKRRLAASRHHSATHVVMAALRKLYGNNCVQCSSHLDADHFRVDVRCSKALDVEKIEDISNEWIKEGGVTVVKQMHIRETDDAVRLEHEKYDDHVTVVELKLENGKTISRELCCGTHVLRLTDVGRVVITGERSCGLHTRSISGTTARAHEAIEHAQKVATVLNEVAKSVERHKAIADGYVPLSEIQHQLRTIKADMALLLLGYIAARTYTRQIEALEKSVKSLIKRHSHQVAEPLIKERLDKVLSTQGSVPVVVSSIQFDCDPGALFRTLRNEYKTATCFVALNSCDGLTIESRVPAEHTRDSFNAQRWCEDVLGKVPLQSQNGAPTGIPPEFVYRIKTTEPVSEQILNDIVRVARLFVVENL